MNVRQAVLVPVIAIALVGVPLAGFVLDENVERVSARSSTQAPAQDTQDDTESAGDGDGKAKGKAKGKGKGKAKAEKADRAAEKAAEKAAAAAAHAAAMKAWARCVAEAVASPGPDKPKPWRACPQKPLGPGRAVHEKEKATPPGHAKQAAKPAGR